MRKLGLFFLISLLTGNTYAQNYFVLLQSDNRQPFYVRLGGLRYSSSSEGHLILAQLKDSTYTVAIGFPSRPGAEQTYSIGTAQKDQEFLIKDHGDAGWGLYAPQSREWITAIGRSGGREEVRAIGVRRDDAFSRLMAGVVQDTAVLYNDYAGADLAISRAAATPAGTSPSSTTSAPSSTTSAPTATTSVPSAASSAPSSTTAAPTAASSAPSAAAAKPAKTGANGSNPSTTATFVTDTSLGSQPVASKSDSPNISVATSSARPDSHAVASTADSSGRSLAAIPDAASSAVLPAASGHSGTAKQTPPGNQTVAAIHPDTVSMTPKPIYRPTSGNAQHKSAPVVDSASALASNPPATDVVKVSEKRLTRNMRLVYADKANGAKADTVVVMIPLDTSRAAVAKPRVNSPDSTLTTKSRVASSDSSRVSKPHPNSADAAQMAKSHLSSRDSIRVAKSRMVPTDSTHLAKSRKVPTDSTRIAKSHTATSDSAHSVKLHPTPDSARATAGGTRQPNPDSPSQSSTVRAIVPTPVNPPADKTRANDSAKKPATKPALPYVNSDCHNFATEYDVDKLRVRMLEGTKDEDRVATALKVFKTKCFSTRQIRALSEVFTADAGKYRFFETAYPFAADEHFHDLVTQLADAAYINKFKTLTGSH